MTVTNAIAAGLAFGLFFSSVCTATIDTKTFIGLPKKPTVVIGKYHCKVTPYKIAVIDTGFGSYNGLGHDAHLCKFGHKDFTYKRAPKNKDDKALEVKIKAQESSFNTKVPVPIDDHGHGTNIAGIIEEYAQQSGAPFCLVILKYYSSSNTPMDNLKASIEAITYATNLKVDFINYSAGGLDANIREFLAVKAFTDQGGRFIASAGNEHSDLAKLSFFPASYKLPIVVVGNLSRDGNIETTSNRGAGVTRWEIGEDVKAYGITLTGTSQATAVATGKIIIESETECNEKFLKTVESIKETQNVASRNH